MGRKRAMLKKLGKYEIEREVGRGAMGVVYRARDPLIDRSVALKTMSTALASDEKFVGRFFSEARAAGKLSHTNVVTIYEINLQDDIPYIAMEFLEGVNLESLIATQSEAPFSLGRKLDICLQICAGLEYAHQQGVIHRDIKPANIVVLNTGTVKIVDFGIARLANQSTTVGNPGTFLYMSPEHFQGHRIDARSDLWALGVMFHELLTGLHPFLAAQQAEVMFRIMSDTPPKCSSKIPGCPLELDDILARAMDKNRDTRYQSVSDMAFDLESVAAGVRRVEEGDREQVRKAREAGLQLERRKRVLEALAAAHASGDAGKFVEARARLEEARRTDPSNPEIHAVALLIEEAERSRARMSPAAAPPDRASVDDGAAMTGTLRAVPQDLSATARAIAPDLLGAAVASQRQRTTADGAERERLRQEVLRQERERQQAVLQEARLYEELRLEAKRHQRVRNLLDTARHECASENFMQAGKILDSVRQLDPENAEVEVVSKEIEAAQQSAWQIRRREGRILEIQHEADLLLDRGGARNVDDAIRVLQQGLVEFDEPEVRALLERAMQQKSLLDSAAPSPAGPVIPQPAAKQESSRDGILVAAAGIFLVLLIGGMVWRGSQPNIPPHVRTVQPLPASLADSLAKARALYDQGRYEEAVTAYQAALKAFPNDSDARDGLSKATAARDAANRANGGRPR